MATNEKLNIIIKADDKASTPVERIKQKFEEFRSSIGLKLIGGLAAAGAGIAGVGLALGKLAIDAAPLEGIQGAFEGLAESAGKGADEMLAALKKGSAGMITQRDLMQGFNKAAQLVSKDFAVQLPDAMEYLGKVSQATGQDMNFMLDSLITGVGRMSPMILDNLGIQVSLEEATAKAADMFGVEASELTKAQQQAGLMNVVLEKLKTNTAAMPAVTGSAAQQFGAFKVQLQDAKDQIGLAVLPLMTKLVGVLSKFATDAIPKVVDWVTNKLIPALNTFWAWTEANIIPLLQKLIAWLGEVLPPVIQALASFWENTLLPAIKVVWQFLFVTMMPVWEALWNLLKTLGEVVIAALAGFWTNILQPALETVWRFIKDNVIPIFQGLSRTIGGISGVIQTVVDWIQRMIDKLKNFKLPSWLQRGSPAPIEITLGNMSSLLKNINADLPALQLGGAGSIAPTGGGAGSTIYVTQNIYGAQGQDVQTLAHEIIRQFSTSIGRATRAGTGYAGV